MELVSTVFGHFFYTKFNKTSVLKLSLVWKRNISIDWSLSLHGNSCQ